MFNKVIVFYVSNHYVKYYLILYKDLLFFSQKIPLVTDTKRDEKYFSTFKQTLCILILIMWTKMFELNCKNIFLQLSTFLKKYLFLQLKTKIKIKINMEEVNN